MSDSIGFFLLDLRVGLYNKISVIAKDFIQLLTLQCWLMREFSFSISSIYQSKTQKSNHFLNHLLTIFKFYFFASESIKSWQFRGIFINCIIYSYYHNIKNKMPRQSPYQTKGVGYGSFSNPNMHLNLANNYNGQIYTNQYNQPGQIHQNAHSGAFYQPTGINQGMYMTYERQRSSSSSSRQSNKSPSRLEQWKRRRMMKKQGVVYTPAMQGEQPGRMQNIKNRINNVLR